LRSVERFVAIDAADDEHVDVAGRRAGQADRPAGGCGRSARAAGLKFSVGCNRCS
jgi:hypothetical protein